VSISINSKEGQFIGKLTPKTVICIFLSRGSRKPLIQDIVADIKCQERKLDIRIIPVWKPRSHARIVLADMGSKMHTRRYR
jgi:hypothetical protein